MTKQTINIQTDRRKLKRYKRKYPAFVTFKVHHTDMDADYAVLGQWCIDHFGYCCVWMEAPTEARYQKWFSGKILLEDYFFFRDTADALVFKLSLEATDVPSIGS